VTSLLVRRTAPILHDYQREAVARLEAVIADGKRPLLVAPTGSGKTVMLADLICRRVARGGRVIFLAPRRELVHQTCAKFDDVNVEHGVLLAGADERAGVGAAVQVASIDTLVARVLKRKTLSLPKFDLAIVDEAHLSITKIRTELVHGIADVVVGATATPTRKDGRALGLLYDTIVEPATTAELTAASYLVPARYFSWPTPDLRGVRVVAGDYNLEDLDAVMNRAPLLADVVQTWLAHAADRRTVVFCTSIAHAVAVAEAFRRVDVAAEHVDAGTPPRERTATFDRFASGRTQVLTNCFLAAYGFDLPVLSCVVLARPTRSLMLFLQMLGRGLRIAEGKRDCLVLDHAGCVHRHGFATDEREWTLTGQFALSPSATRGRPERTPKECPECRAMWTGSAECPECGFNLRPKGRMVQAIDGELVEIAPDATTADEQDRAVFFAELRAIATERGYKPGWAAVNFRERYGDWPPRAWNGRPAALPSPATKGWVRSRLIAYAKAKSQPRVA
jgi:superfamily II DNA or RNA helicase